MATDPLSDPLVRTKDGLSQRNGGREFPCVRRMCGNETRWSTSVRGPLASVLSAARRFPCSVSVSCHWLSPQGRILFFSVSKRNASERTNLRVWSSKG